MVVSTAQFLFQICRLSPQYHSTLVYVPEHDTWQFHHCTINMVLAISPWHYHCISDDTWQFHHCNINIIHHTGNFISALSTYLTIASLHYEHDQYDAWQFHHCTTNMVLAISLLHCHSINIMQFHHCTININTGNFITALSTWCLAISSLHYQHDTGIFITALSCLLEQNVCLTQGWGHFAPTVWSTLNMKIRFKG